MKVLKKILKWFICVFLTFATVFTISMLFRDGFEALSIRIATIKSDEIITENMEEMEEAAKNYEERMKGLFSNEYANGIYFTEQYNKYPAGTTYLVYMFSTLLTLGNSILFSLIVGLILGTSIFILLSSKEKDGIKLIIVLYIVTIILLGFFQGFNEIAGDNLTLINYWVFPRSYIIPTTIAFILVVLIRLFRQKDLAKKLNEKLNQKISN